MRKKILITFIMCFILLLLVVIFYNYKSTNNKNSLHVDYFVNNLSWDSWIRKQVPYKKWDEIEISIILKNYTKYKNFFDLSIEKLIQLLKLYNVKIDYDENIIWSKESIIVKITWNTEDSWITPSNLEEFINISSRVVKEWNENEKDKSPSNEINTIKDYSNKKYDIKLSKYEIISNENNLITLSGVDLNEIKWVWIWEVIYFIKSHSWINYINIEQMTLNRWIHLIYYLLKNDELRASDESMNVIQFNDKVYISNIMPNVFSNKNSRRITVQWKWFKNTISIQLSNNQVFKKVDFKIVSDSVLALNIWKNFQTWTYNMNIMTLDGIYEIKNYNFTVTE